MKREIGIVLLALTVFFLILEGVVPRYFTCDDNATYFLPCYLYNEKSLRETGELAVINFHQFLGQTHLAQGQSGVLYPPAYLAIILSRTLFGNPLAAIDLLVFLHLLIGAAGMIVFFRTLEIRGRVAMAGAILYGTMPYLILFSRNWVFIAYTAAYAPWALWMVEKLRQENNHRWIAGYALLKSCFFYQGYTQYCLYLVVFEVAYAALRWQGVQKTGLFLWRFFLGNLLSLLLILPLLIPMAETVSLSAHRSRSIPWDQLLVFYNHPLHYIAAQVYTFAPELYFSAATSALHCGGSLVLFFLGWRALRQREPLSIEMWRWILLWSLAFLLSTPGYALIAWIPPFQVLRWPIKWYFFVAWLHVILLTVGLVKGFRRPFLSERVAFGILLGAITSNLIVIFLPISRAAFSSYRFDSVESLNALWGEQAGRLLPLGSEDEDVSVPGRMAYQFPSAAGRFAFSGYDQMLSALNERLVLGINISGKYQLPLRLSDREHLNRWSVRYFTTRPKTEVKDAFSEWPNIRKIYENPTLSVFENPDATPFASFATNPTEALPIHWGVNEFKVNQTEGGGKLTVTIAPIPHLYSQCDSNPPAPLESKGEPPVIEVPPGTREVRVFYLNPRFKPSVLISLVALAGTLALLLRPRKFE